MSMRIGVVGLGRIGQLHARNVVLEAPDAELVLIGRSVDRLDATRKSLTVSLSAESEVEAEPKISMRTLSDAWADGLDGVIISTSTGTHPDLTRYAVEHGVPCLVEKPLSLDLAEIPQLSEQLESHGVPIMVAFHRRYDEGHQRLRQRIRSGSMGPIRLIHAVNHDHRHVDPDYIPHSGGIWRDLLIHDFDTIPWLLDDRPVSVYATGGVLDAEVYSDCDDFDTASAVITFASGSQALVSGGRNVASGQDVATSVYGSDAAFSAGVDDHTPVEPLESGTAPAVTTYEDFMDRFAATFRGEIRHFLAMVRGETDSLTPPSAGIVAARLAMAAEESARTGRPTRIEW
ncbi:Gfo/Idh/MocA family oxidoreductase [Brevibacterium sanguinis]|uniref:Gfo/Idh/MocA family protein n=1 Tax=Brevibacterium TaxID=1696 RepID=UPI001BA5298E|nr:Gfo/Idh/MocA family oxidoreductase [Brevibacterium sp. W7.2]